MVANVFSFTINIININISKYEISDSKRTFLFYPALKNKSLFKYTRINKNLNKYEILALDCSNIKEFNFSLRALDVLNIDKETLIIGKILNKVSGEDLKETISIYNNLSCISQSIKLIIFVDLNSIPKIENIGLYTELISDVFTLEYTPILFNELAATKISNKKLKSVKSIMPYLFKGTITERELNHLKNVINI